MFMAYFICISVFLIGIVLTKAIFNGITEVDQESLTEIELYK